MKYNVLRKISIAAITAVALFLASCEKEDDSPENSVDARDKFVRSWSCSETSQTQGTSNYTITISKDVTSSNQIIVKNFYQLGNSTNTIMIVDGNNVVINSQNVSGHIIAGSGHYNSSSSLTFDFTADDGITPDTAHISAH
jgi:hypothetical protein